MRKLLGFMSVLVLIAAFVGTLVFLRQKSAEPPVVHETLEPHRTEIVKKTVATGSVVPRQEVEIKPQVSGIVEELLVEPGALVSAGDLLARIRIIPNMVSLASSENRVNRARIALDDAKRELERNRRLFGEGTISESRLQESEIAWRQAREERSAAAENLQIVRRGTTAKSGAVSNTEVRSTLSGMVLEVPVELGDSVIEANNFNDGTTVATIADMDQLIFKGKLDESEVGKVRPGMKLLLTIGAIEGRVFEARLEHVAPKGVSESGAIQFEIRAALKPDDKTFIRANYSASADIVLDRRADVLAIDEALLQFEEGRTFVEVETAPQVFERRFVETGLSDGISIEILEGLHEGERVKKPLAI